MQFSRRNLVGTCQACNRNSNTISDGIGFCAECIRDHFDALWPEIKKVHDRSRRVYGLPLEPPRSADGVVCPLCMHRCQIPEGGTGFCGLRYVEGGRLHGGRPHEGNLYAYHDSLPTNCVGSYVCPGGTGAGYPEYAVSRGPEYGYKNLAVFYHACAFNCLYCQNFHFKERTFSRAKTPAREVAGALDEETTCLCFFGGDPTPQVLHALKTSKLALAHTSPKVLRVCWETNGSAQTPYMAMMAELSMKTGGCIKIDLKAWDEHTHSALCGVSNRKTLENFRLLAGWTTKRPCPPFLLASTLLVPGYVDEQDVEAIAAFIADVNPEIPYSLLGFYPHFQLRDLPTTSRRHAIRCKAAAERQGLRNVHIGNRHLLGEDY
jgi:pyruvate formate lyase activating enzyme